MRGIQLVPFRIEGFEALAGEIIMLSQVEVSTRVDTYPFFETERHQELKISSGSCVVSHVILIVIPIAFIA